MSTELGITATVDVQIVTPLPDGRWVAHPGTLHVVDGYIHKVSLAGIEARSGEGFGVTITFHAFQPASGEHASDGIARWVIENGKVFKINRVAEGVLLVPFDR